MATTNDPLVTAADLEAIGFDLTDVAEAEAWIAAASAAVRDAAGSPIAPAIEATVTLMGTPSQWLSVPIRPVREVGGVVSVDLDTSGWRYVGGRLWRAGGWAPHGSPSAIEARLTVGYDQCPADLLPLIASLVAGQKAAAAEGFDPKRGMSYERIDDYQYGLRTGGDEIQSATELTERTKAMLAARFGGGAYVTGSY